ncbi:MAG: hypothetical protein ACTSW1_12080 [Candidatus Hodarchaeales archaeon]
MSVLDKIIFYLENVHESTISEMTKIATGLDRNRLSGFLRACEEIGIIESVGKASHRKYRLKKDYLLKIEALSIKSHKTQALSEGRKKWHYPFKKQLKERSISWSDEIPGTI